MSRPVYTLLFYCALPLIFLRLLWRARKAPAYRQRWRERLGWYDTAAPAHRGSTVVFHAVSVGETHAAQPLIEKLLQTRDDLRVVVTCTTPTGSARIRELFGTRVEHVYLPYDLPGAVERFLARFDPALLVLLETELWPNLLAACHARGCKVVLANARLSARSASRYASHAALTRSMLDAIDTVVAQAAADGQRFVSLGLPGNRLLINGSLKFDMVVNREKVQAARELKARWRGRPVWIAASTRDGEDIKVLRAFRIALQQLPALLLVLVPRHPERFALAASMARDSGFSVQRFSEGGSCDADTQVLVGDTMGDMHFYYALANVAFVGGSLVDTGCQNLIEPAALGLPVLSGPSLYNFQAVSDLLREKRGLIVVPDEAALAREVVALINQPEEARVMGERARQVVAGNQGATDRLTALILDRIR
ncbi:MAG: lipid IV(A) 3-deoxy-D-manno-octulosonic acid transferase [Gammaproteobacteria bacterium]